MSCCSPERPNYEERIAFKFVIGGAVVVESDGGPNLAIEKLFSVSDQVDAFQRHRSIMDLRYADKRVEPLHDRGEAPRGSLNSWPFYTGIDVGLYAKLSPASASRSSDREPV